MADITKILDSLDEGMALEDFVPSKEQDERRTKVYKAFADMRDVSTQKYPEFNDRTLAEFLDDSQKRMNGYVVPREAQGKEEWQANVFTPFTRNKVKTLIASTTKDIPQISITAVDENNQQSFVRAEVMEALVRASYLEKGQNPEMVLQTDGWNLAVNGTVIKYDGYLQTKQKVKMIQSFDLTTGEVQFEEKEVEVEDRPVEVNVPLNKLYIRDAYIRELQQQPDLIWVSHYSKESFLEEWGNYANAKFVQPAGELEKGDQDLFFGQNYGDRMEKTSIEVLRYYNKYRDEYIVYANGVELLNAPMLWGRKKKLYPFADTRAESFANTDFFWGNSIPNILMPEQDTANALNNAMIDKTTRSLHAPMLIGVENRDAFEMEDEMVTGDTKIYVNDVNAVKEMPVMPVNASEFQMLQSSHRGIDLSTTDAVQSGVSGSGSTAREIVISNQRADELRGLFFAMLKDLWIKKTRLRVNSILLNYSNLKKVEMIIGGEKREVFANQFNVPNQRLSDGTTGTLQVNVFGDRSQLPTPEDVDAQEAAGRQLGQRVEVVGITSDYLDNWEYEMSIESQSFRAKNRALEMALVQEQTQHIATLYPEIFQANKELFFRNDMKRFDDDPERYLQSKPQAAAGPNGEGIAGTTPVGVPERAPTQSAAGAQLSQSTRSLPQLASI